MEPNWSELLTEQPSDAVSALDTSTSLEIVTLMNQADRTVADVVAKALPAIAEGVDRIVERLRRGGRLFYVGAGTSGRLGALDAAECPPTFNTPPDLVQAILAGGPRAFLEAAEGAEDRAGEAPEDLRSRGVGPADAVVGITASGRTPYVLAALEYARSVGALTLSLACNTPSPAALAADIAVELPTGPEVLMGSTRLKAGTAQKMALNMISTAVMVRLGKAYQNLMVDLQASNEKLRERSRRIVMHAAGIPYGTAAAALELADGDVKRAIVMVLRGVGAPAADALLAESGGLLRAALRSPSPAKPE